MKTKKSSNVALKGNGVVHSEALVFSCDTTGLPDLPLTKEQLQGPKQRDMERLKQARTKEENREPVVAPGADSQRAMCKKTGSAIPKQRNWFTGWQAEILGKRMRKRNAAQRKLNKIGRKEGFKIEGDKVTFNAGVTIGHKLLQAMTHATCPGESSADSHEQFENLFGSDLAAVVGNKS